MSNTPLRIFSRLAFGLLATAFVVQGCGCPPPEAPALTVTAYVADDAHAGVIMAAEDLAADLAAVLTHDVSLEMGSAPACAADRVVISVAGIEASTPGGDPIDAQTFYFEEERCGTGAHLVVGGGSALAAQWAVYDVAQRLGVRYYHPEETFYPTPRAWPDDAASGLSSPDFFERWFHVHRTHPVELAAPLDDTDVDMAGFQQRWIDWNIKNRQTRVDGWDAAYLDDYPYLRGLPRGSGLNLLNTQQGMVPIIDPDDPRPETEQILDVITARMAPVEGRPDVSYFGFQFNPSEFTEADPEQTVARLTFIADTFAEMYPEVQLSTINHGTFQEPVQPYGTRFFNLSQEAPNNLDVKTHTLMFYDLERPAPVYGNTDFAFLFDFIEAEAPQRRIHHYPESSWWLTFDIPVPLYLVPATLDARERDIALLRPMLSTGIAATTGVYGHEVFTSGQAWGYWLVDYCVTQMTWDADITARACIADLTRHLDRNDAVDRAWDEALTAQATQFRDPELLRFLVGSDDETEIAALAGIDFHPLPPAPADVLKYNDAQATELAATLERLRAVANDHRAWGGFLDEAAFVEEGFLRNALHEMRDGFDVTGVRADHAIALYETVLQLRAALNAGSLESVDEAFEGVARVRDFTADAQRIIREREAAYRYPPALTIAGDEPGSDGAIENTTIYPYRYLSRTHRLFYYHRPDEQLATLFGDGLELVGVNRRVLPDGHPLEVSLLQDDAESVLWDRGDGTTADGAGTYTYGAQGAYSWTLDATGPSGVVHHEDQAIVVERRFVFPRGRLKVEAPEGGNIIGGLLPGLILGTFTDTAGEQMAIARVDDSFEERNEIVAAHAEIPIRPRTDLVSDSGDLVLPLRDIGDVNIYDAVISIEQDPQYDHVYWADFEGTMNIPEIVDLLVSVGGFEPVGARELVADVLGYTPDTLPDELQFLIRADGTEENLDDLSD